MSIPTVAAGLGYVSIEIKEREGDKPKYRSQSLAPKQYEISSSTLVGKAAAILGAPQFPSATQVMRQQMEEKVEAAVAVPPMVTTPAPTTVATSKPRYRTKAMGAGIKAPPPTLPVAIQHHSYPLEPRKKMAVTAELAYQTHLSVFDIDGHTYAAATVEVDAGKQRAPLDVVFWVDRSGSMNSAAVPLTDEERAQNNAFMEEKEKMKQIYSIRDFLASIGKETRFKVLGDALNSALDLLEDQDRFSIITFDNEAAFAYGHKCATAANKEEFRKLQQIPGFQPDDGGTNIVKGFEESLQVLDAASEENRKAGIAAASCSLGLTDGVDPAVTAKAVQDIVNRHLFATTTMIGISEGHNKKQCKIFADAASGAYIDSTDMTKLRSIILKSLEKVQRTVFEGQNCALKSEGAKIAGVWHALNVSPLADDKEGLQQVKLPNFESRKKYKILFEVEKGSSESAKISAIFKGKDLLSGKEISIEASETIAAAREKVDASDVLFVEFFHYQNLLNQLKKNPDKGERSKLLDQAISQMSADNVTLICSLVKLRQENEKMDHVTFATLLDEELSNTYECSWTSSQLQCHQIANAMEKAGVLFRINADQATEKVKEVPRFFRLSASAGDGFLVACSKKDDGGIEEEILEVLEEGAVRVADSNSVRSTKVYKNIQEYIIDCTQKVN